MLLTWGFYLKRMDVSKSEVFKNTRHDQLYISFKVNTQSFLFSVPFFFSSKPQIFPYQKINDLICCRRKKSSSSPLWEAEMRRHKGIQFAGASWAATISVMNKADGF